MGVADVGALHAVVEVHIRMMSPCLGINGFIAQE